MTIRRDISRRALILACVVTLAPATRAQSVAPSGPAPRTRLANGLSVAIAPVEGAGSVLVHGRIEAGSMFDGDKQGLSLLATRVLAQPLIGEAPGHPTIRWTIDHDPTAFASFRWIEFQASAQRDQLGQLLRAVAGRLGRATEPEPPTLPEIQVDRLRQEAVAGIEGLESRDDTALWRRGLERIYPTGSPLATPPWGTVAGLGRIRAADVLAFLRRFVVPVRTTIVLTGDVDPSVASALLRDTLGRIARGKPARNRARAPRPRAPRQFSLVSVPRPTVGDTILVLLPGDRSKPRDAVATKALLHLLGAGAAGLLDRELVRTGYASSVAVSLEEDGAPGFLLVRATSVSGGGGKAATRIQELLQTAALGTFTAKDLESWSSAKAASAQLSLAQLNDTARRLFARGAPVALVAAPRSSVGP